MRMNIIIDINNIIVRSIKSYCLLLVITYLFILFLISIPAYAQVSEYEVKAIFLQKFTAFIDYPKESGIDEKSKPFTIGVIGENPFGNILEDYYSIIEIKDKKVKILYISDTSEISSCNILFISKSEKKHLSEILSFTRHKPILTVSDSKGFAERGVLINFYLDYEKVRFEINYKAVKESGIYMNFRLLNIARIVETEGKN